MLNAIIWFLQILEVFVGFALISSVFMYENEELNVSNTLEKWWIHADDLKRTAVSRHIAFMQTATGFANAILDRIFGDRLISLRTISVTACLSLASLNLTATYVQNNHIILRKYFIYIFNNFFNYSYLEAKNVAFLIWSLVVALFGRVYIDVDAMNASYINTVSIVTLLSVFLPAYFRKYYWVTTLTLILLAYFNLSNSFIHISEHSNIVFFDYPLMMLCTVVIGVFCDLAAISTIRILLRHQECWTSWSKTFISLLFQIFMAVGLIIAPLLVGTFDMLNTRFSLTLTGNIFHAIAISSATNILSSLLSLILFISAFILLSHKAIWPLITRFIYSLIQFYNSTARKKTIISLGIALIIHGFGKKIDIWGQFFK